jgi:RNA polymerase sigma-70 factor (sigma-E family)
VEPQPASPIDRATFCQELWKPLVGTLSLYCRDPFAAEDLAQDTLVRVCQHWARVSRMESPRGWAFATAINIANSRFRRMRLEAKARRRVEMRHDEPDSGADWADAIVLRDALDALPSRQRAAVVLRYFADLSITDTAVALGCAPGTVKALTHQALDRLRTSGFVADEEDGAHVG